MKKCVGELSCGSMFIKNIDRDVLGIYRKYLFNTLPWSI